MASSPDTVTLRDLAASARRINASTHGDTASVISSILDEIRRLTGLEAVLLGPQDVAEGRIAFKVPVAVGPHGGDAVAICAIDPGNEPVDEDRLSFAHLLARAGATQIALDLTRQQLQARSERSDAALLEVLKRARAGQDQVGNSLAVVLGWLRMLDTGGSTTEGSVGGIHVAIRRLEETQSAIADILRGTAAAAVAELASDPVNASVIMRQMGRATTDGPDTWILANRTHLLSFLEGAAGALMPGEVLTDDSWSLTFREPGLLTTTIMMSLAASGGSLTATSASQTAQWRLAAHSS